MYGLDTDERFLRFFFILRLLFVYRRKTVLLIGYIFIFHMPVVSATYFKLTGCFSSCSFNLFFFCCCWWCCLKGCLLVELELVCAEYFFFFFCKFSVFFVAVGLFLEKGRIRIQNQNSHLGNSCLTKNNTDAKLGASGVIDDLLLLYIHKHKYCVLVACVASFCFLFCWWASTIMAIPFRFVSSSRVSQCINQMITILSWIFSNWQTKKKGAREIEWRQCPVLYFL